MAHQRDELSTMDQLHQFELELMDEVDRICREHDIPYFLDSGSALGAVRHGGFIPWDDDMDIGMLRSDYDRFLEIAGRELKPEYALQTHETDPHVYKFYAKIRKNNTLYPSRISGKYENQGIAIDLFAFDRIADDEATAREELQRLRKLYRLIRIRATWRETGNMARKICGLLLHIVSEKRLRARYHKLCTMHNDTEASRVCCYLYKMSQKKELFFDIDRMMPVKPVRFEDRVYRIMNDPDHYLTVMYGDYMKLPDEEDQKMPDLSRVVFNTKESQ